MKTWQSTRLHNREREAIEEAVRTLKNLHSIEKIILFGSKARGDADKNSDIDLLLIASHPLHWKEEKAIVEELFDIGMKHDVIFSPLFSYSDEWDHGIFRDFPIYHEIIRDGAMVQ